MFPLSVYSYIKRLISVFSFCLIGGLAILLLLVIQPFLYPIFWAGIIAILFHPVHRMLDRAVHQPHVSAILTMTIAFVVIFLPLSIIAILTLHESIRLYGSLADGQFLQQIQHLPYIAQIKETWTASAADTTKTTTQYLIDHLSGITQDSVRFILLVFITLYSLFYFLKDGGSILRRLERILPLKEEHEELLYARFISTLRATLKSTLIVGGIQGILAGVLFFATGIPGAFLWAVALFLLSMIPGIGAFMVWLPIGLVMLALGHTASGVAILFAGFFVFGAIDNIVRPKLIGKDVQMHPLLALFSSLGGIALFGIAGLVAGPVIAALFLSVLSIYEASQTT